MAASKDEVAAKADGIVSHMNNDHKDSLAYLATHYADLVKPLKPNQVKMVTIDSKHFEIAYTTAGSSAPSVGSRGTEVVHIPFFPHLQGYSEVRSRMVDMSKVSEKVITNRKPIIVYRAPKVAFFGGAVLVAAYLALRSDTLPTLSLVKNYVPADSLSRWNELRAYFGGPAKMDAFMKSIARVHLFEATIMALVCRYRDSGSLTSLKWIITTAILGIPSWIAFFTVNSSSRAMRRAIVGDHDASKKRK
ncbi:hypothetical protein BCV70DRAFT_199767 [Testicularia cyperi]|uniref:DUF2470 domain-containing protein n=1 Tax=Testicularia cyperi TaxID=1882483 RepID=A0A317XT14_9BASI|nr:hypothetical protein BCV70DRAFT_199767 [Testicularia cyperi]